MGPASTPPLRPPVLVPAALDVRNMEVGDFCVKFHVQSKVDGFVWALVAVYGAAQA